MYPGYFLAGAVILYLILFVIPGVFGIVLSFSDWHVARDISTLKYVGIKNFARVFSADERYFKYLSNTIQFAIVTSIFKSLLAFLIALVLTSGQIKFSNFHRLAMFFPSIISVLITGLIFRSILHPGKGILNVFLSSVGLEILTRDWLNNVAIAFNSVMAVDIWRGVGYIMVVYIAGLISIPKSYFEAATVDGANYFQRLIVITIPLLKTTIIVTTIMNLIYGLRVFDIVYVLTKGGPGDVTDVMYTSVFREFGQGNFAMGSAISSVMFFILVITGSFSIKLMINSEVEY